MLTWDHPHFYLFPLSLFCPAGTSVKIPSLFPQSPPHRHLVAVTCSEAVPAQGWTSPGPTSSPYRVSAPTPPRSACTWAAPVCKHLSHAGRLKTEFGNHVGSSKCWAMGYNYFPQSPPCTPVHTAQDNDSLNCCPETLLDDIFSPSELQSWSLAGEPLVCIIPGG